MPEHAAAVDWRAVRAEFPSLNAWTYLNTATFGQLARRTAEAMVRHLDRREELACSDFLSWFDDADAVRRSLARLIHCRAEDIAFVPNASTALAILINGIDWRASDRIVTLDNEFPNNVYFPALKRASGVEFIETGWDGFYEAVTPATRLVLLSEVNYSTGFRAPLTDLVRHAHERGALVFVDGTQSLGALRYDAAAIGADVYAVHGYKWLLAPNGAAFMYVSPAVREWLSPLVVGWRSHRAWREVNNLYNGAPQFSPDAERYEGGMLAFPVICGMQAAVDMLLEIGPEAIERRVAELAAAVRAALRRAGARVLADEAEHYDAPIVAARFPGRSPSAIAAALKRERVLVSARHDFLRVSAHFYNDESDIERFGEALART